MAFTLGQQAANSYLEKRSNALLNAGKTIAGVGMMGMQAMGALGDVKARAHELTTGNTPVGGQMGG